MHEGLRLHASPRTATSGAAGAGAGSTRTASAVHAPNGDVLAFLHTPEVISNPLLRRHEAEPALHDRQHVDLRALCECGRRGAELKTRGTGKSFPCVRYASSRQKADASLSQ